MISKTIRRARLQFKHRLQMNELLVAILFAIVLALLAWGMFKPRRVYEFPFHIGAVTFAFILVQVPGLVNDHFVPDAALTKTIVFLIICLAMCWLGWSRNALPLGFFRITFGERGLLVAASVLSLVGAYFFYALSRLPGDVTIAVQMTGVPVIYVFFSRLLVYGLVISVLCMIHRFSWPALAIVAFDLAFFLDRIIAGGRRADTAELIMIFALSLWFYHRKAIPRGLALGGIVLGTLLMNSFGDYRAITKENDGPAWSQISKIDIVANTQNVFLSGGEEFRNAIQRVSYADETMEFDYGLAHWNAMVFSFVPAQLLGDRFKQRLMITLPVLARDYNPVLGTTETGLADAFQSFWYLGALKFFLLAYVMRRILASAEAGEFAGQFTYILSVVPAMHAISHRTDWVLMIWVHMLMFALPALAFAIIPGQRGAHPPGAVTHSVQ